MDLLLLATQMTPPQNGIDFIRASKIGKKMASRQRSQILKELEKNEVAKKFLLTFARHFWPYI